MKTCFVCSLLTPILGWRVVKVFINEEDAKVWVNEEPDYRIYKEIEIE